MGAVGPPDFRHHLIAIGVPIQVQIVTILEAVPAIQFHWVVVPIAEWAHLTPPQPLAQALQVEMMAAVRDGVDLDAEADCAFVGLGR